MSTPLDPTGNTVQVGRSLLRTPGLAGTAEALDPLAGSQLRDGEQATAEFEQALANEGVQPQETIEITGAQELPTGAGPTRSTRLDEAAVELEVPHPGDAFGQAVIAVDETGVITWNIPVDAADRLDTTRGGDTLTYVLRRHVAPPPEDGATRGLIGAVGKKLLKVVVFPLVDPLIGAVAEHFAGRWEEAKRPYRVRSFTPDDYTAAEGAPIGADRWRELAGPDRTLLLIHGTFSRAHAAFGGMPAGLVHELHRRYDGRVVAFDHFTLSEDPRDNVEWLMRSLPDDADLTFDVLCHSRGGLVARVLGEKLGEVSAGARSVALDRVVFVAAPNAGTVLADAGRVGDLVDRYTTVLNLFPDNGVTEALEAVITVVKQLAVGAVGGLEGIQSMRPRGPFLEWLNDGPRGAATYHALGADYEPTAPGLLSFVRDGVMDRIFGAAANDLVVPTAGVHAENGSGFFPIAEPYEFATAAGVNHSGFFRNQTAQERILEWLA